MSKKQKKTLGQGLLEGLNDALAFERGEKILKTSSSDPSNINKSFVKSTRFASITLMLFPALKADYHKSNPY